MWALFVNDWSVESIEVFIIKSRSVRSICVRSKNVIFGEIAYKVCVRTVVTVDPWFTMHLGGKKICTVYQIALLFESRFTVVYINSYNMGGLTQGTVNQIHSKSKSSIYISRVYCTCIFKILKSDNFG